MKAHSFFQYFNWRDLYDKKIKPPFVPTLLGADDVSNFDPEFTLQPARLTPPGGEMSVRVTLIVKLLHLMSKCF